MKDLILSQEALEEMGLSVIDDYEVSLQEMIEIEMSLLEEEVEYAELYRELDDSIQDLYEEELWD